MSASRTLAGRTVMVTGATDGIGKETARELAGRGARLLLHGRDAGRAAAARRDICATTGNDDVQVVLADFTSLAQVRALAAQVRTLTGKLHVLVDNAGVYQERRHLTEDGLETTFQVNYLAPFLLTNLLLEPLLAAAPSRVVVVSSAVHQRAPVDLNDLQGARRYDGYSAYGLSKLGDLLFTYELAERLRRHRRHRQRAAPRGRVDQAAARRLSGVGRRHSRRRRPHRGLPGRLTRRRGRHRQLLRRRAPHDVVAGQLQPRAAGGVLEAQRAPHADPRRAGERHRLTTRRQPARSRAARSTLAVGASLTSYRLHWPPGPSAAR